jgi:hypothetical protein
MKPLRFVAVVKHFVPATQQVYNPTDSNNIIYDYDDEFIFSYDLHTLRIEGTSWSKEVIPDKVADTIKAYFYGTNYHLANIEKLLD